MWGGRRDSNPRQPGSQPGALPTELRPPSVPPRAAGVPGRTRTCDPRLRRPMLYPPELRARPEKRPWPGPTARGARIIREWLNQRQFPAPKGADGVDGQEGYSPCAGQAPTGQVFTSFSAAIERMALRCERTVGRIDAAKAFASGSCPDRSEEHTS